MVFVRGQVGQDLDTAQSVCIGDAAGQAEQAMRNIATLLDEAGFSHESCADHDLHHRPRYREDVYRTVGRHLRRLPGLHRDRGQRTGPARKMAGRGGRDRRRHSRLLDPGPSSLFLHQFIQTDQT
ncbi:MAG: RidA family protein [Geminicoccaceae bacterium]